MCVRDGLATSVAYVALLLLPLSFFLGVGAPSLSLAGFMFKAARRGSFSLFFTVASAACVYETGLPLLFAYVALLLLPWSCFLGSGTPLFSLVGFTCSKLLACSAWLMVSCCIDSCVFASLELIVIVVIVCVTHRLTLSSSLSPLHAHLP